MAWYYWVILSVIIIFVIAYFNDKIKRERLMKKYNNTILVERLMKGEIWQGQTRGQVIDALGKPLMINEQVLKTKTKYTYKYNRIAKNRYGLKVIIENGLVIGWDKK